MRDCPEVTWALMGIKKRIEENMGLKGDKDKLTNDQNDNDAKEDEKKKQDLKNSMMKNKFCGDSGSCSGNGNCSTDGSKKS